MIARGFRQPIIHLLLATFLLLAVSALLTGCGSDNVALQTQNSRQVKETALKNGLQTIRSAIDQFKADTGTYPVRLQDLVAATAPPQGFDESGDTSKPTVDIVAGTYKGPYFSPQGGINNTGLPINPFAAAPTDAVDTQWTYPSNGRCELHPAVPAAGSTLDGIPYQSL